MPVRIQLSRRKGWRMPPNTVSAARPGFWGNPSAVELDEIRPSGDDYGSEVGPWLCHLNVADKPRLGGFWFSTQIEAIQKAVALFRWRLTDSPTPADVARRDRIHELRGKNLGCWCHLCAEHKDGKPLDVNCDACDPCHVDVLGELANRCAA